MKYAWIAVLIATLFLSACNQGAVTAEAVQVSALQTQAVETAFAVLTQDAPAATATATATLIPPATHTAVPDYSMIKHESIYFVGSSEMVVAFSLNGTHGEFHLTGNDYRYDCQVDPGNPDLLLCRGAYQAPGRVVIFNLHAAESATPILTMEMIIPSMYPPTPEGMYCEIEPLWVPPLTGNYGCYAVTCYLYGTYYDGTPDTCIQPWRWPVP